MKAITKELNINKNEKGIVLPEMENLLIKEEIPQAEELPSTSQTKSENNNESASPEVEESENSYLRIRFKNLSPLKRKTLELLSQHPDLDAIEADRRARVALGLEPQQTKKINKVPSSTRNSYVPAPGNFGTATDKKILSGETILEKLQDLPAVDRKKVLLAVLTNAAQSGKK